MSPTTLTLGRLRRLGYLAAVVERWLPRVEKKADLFGIGDVIAFHPRDRKALLVQCTSIDHTGDRLKRIQGRPELPLLLRAGLAVEVWGWTLRRERWAVKIVAVQGEDLGGIVVEQPPAKRRKSRFKPGDLFQVEE